MDLQLQLVRTAFVSGIVTDGDAGSMQSATVTQVSLSDVGAGVPDVAHARPQEGSSRSPACRLDSTRCRRARNSRGAWTRRPRARTR